jgi:[protein-PII] uridylyltransferase
MSGVTNPSDARSSPPADGSHAFRRDPYDEKVLLPFAREVGTPEVLRKLLALTAADIAAVGPDVLTKWKESLLVELYLRAMQEVSGERETADEPQRLARIADDVVATGASDKRNLPHDRAWIRSELEQFPLRYAYGTSPHRIAVHLGAIRRLQPGGVVIETEFNAPLGTCEYAVIAHNDVIRACSQRSPGSWRRAGCRSWMRKL